MDTLFSLKEPVLIALTLTTYFLAFAQALHAVLITQVRTAKASLGAVIYEAMIVLHLLLACMTANSAHSNFGRILFKLRAFSLDIEPMLWINAVICVLGFMLAVRHKKPLMAPELCMFALSTPPVVQATGQLSWLLFFVDVAFFLFRVSGAVWLDLARAKQQITRLSIAEALKNLPEGVFISFKRRVMLMNDAMRDALVALGVGGHFAENVKVWASVCERAAGGASVGAGGAGAGGAAAGAGGAGADSAAEESATAASAGAEGAGGALAEGAAAGAGSVRAKKTGEQPAVLQTCYVKMPDGRTLMFTRQMRCCGKRKTEQILAVDVTEIEKLNKDIEVTNEKLAEINKQLAAELETLDEACKREAAAQMHKRVHDEIGQRLSILHNWLEGSAGGRAGVDVGGAAGGVAGSAAAGGAIAMAGGAAEANLGTGDVAVVGAAAGGAADMSQAQIVELVSGITKSLRVKAVKPEDEVASVVSTFSQAGVHISVEREGIACAFLAGGACSGCALLGGSCVLVEGEPALQLLAEILREAATNALKHAHAQNVWVKISEDTYGADEHNASAERDIAEENTRKHTIIHISNDGETPLDTPVLGSGLRSMKQQVKRAKGTFRISKLEPFTIEVVLDHPNKGRT